MIYNKNLQKGSFFINKVYTEILFRPFLRRARIVARPPAVRIRPRNPCTFFILRFLRFRKVNAFDAINNKLISV